VHLDHLAIKDEMVLHCDEAREVCTERYAKKYAQSVHNDVVLILEVLLISGEENEDTLPY
jgi:hypothetical protein